MTRYLLRCIASFILFPVIPGSLHASNQGRIFLLKENEGGVYLEKVLLEKDELKVIMGEDLITFILPLGPGQSGDLVRSAEPKNKIVVQYKEDELIVNIPKADGTSRQLPAVKLKDLDTYNVRVNVTGENGVKKVFMIMGYDLVVEDSGPVLDMFGGRIPLQPGDYSVTVETSALPKSAATLSGEIPLTFSDGFLVAKGTLPGGKSGDFIVDFGADGTGIARKFLPPDISISKVTAIAYSDEGVQESKGTMGGAGGTVEQFLGKARVDSLMFGSLRFDDVNAGVLEGEIIFKNREYAGIIGLDLLRRASVVSFEYQTEGSMRFGDQAGIADASSRPLEIPFSLASAHLFVDGSVNDQPVSFIFDTGARQSLVATGLIKNYTGTERMFHGLDGNAIEAREVSVDRFLVGPYAFNDVKMFAADTAVLEGMGLKSHGGLLGNDFLQRFSRVAVDFDRKIISLYD